MNIEVKIEGLERFEALANSTVWYKAQKRTTTESGRKFRTTTVKEVRKIYNIKAKDLKARIRTRVEKGKEGYAWRMQVKGRPIGLEKFGARQTKKGVSVLVRKDSGRKTLSKAFIAKGKVFERVGKKRLPIVNLKTLSVAQMFNKETLKVAFEEVSREYPKRFKHNLFFYLEKR